MTAQLAIKTRQNVLFVHQASELYGSDKVLLYLASGMVGRPHFWPIVVLPDRGPLWDELVAAGVEVHVGEIAKVKRSVFSPGGFVGLLRKLRVTLKHYDAIVAGRPIALVHSNTLAVLGGVFWAWRRRTLHLWHVHEIILSPTLVSKAFPLLARLGSDKLMSNSTLTERWLLDTQPALKSRSVVVFNGLPVQAEPPPLAVDAFRATTAAAPGDLLIVLAGRLNHWKGQGLLIEAAHLLGLQGGLAGVHFLLVGDVALGQDSVRDQLVAQVAELGLSASFSFVPFVADIRPVWAAAAIAVVPSTEPEPFGMVAIEAMAAGVPVVAAAHGGLLDIVEHERTGLLFAPRDAQALALALQRLIAQPELRQVLGQAGRLRQVALFSASSQVAATEQVYADMLQHAHSTQ